MKKKLQNRKVALLICLISVLVSTVYMIHLGNVERAAEESLLREDLATNQDLDSVDDSSITDDLLSGLEDDQILGDFSDITVEEQLLFDQDDVSMTLLSFETDAFTGPGLRVRIENHRDHSVTIMAQGTSVNGFMIPPVFAASVSPGLSSTDSILFFNSELADNSIEKIGIIETAFVVFDSDTFADVFTSDLVVIETSAVNEVVQILPTNLVEKVNQDGVTISYVGFDDENMWGLESQFFIRNETNRMITIQARETSLNNKMISGLMSVDIAPGKMANGSLFFFTEDLEANDIQDIDEIGVRFYVFDSLTFIDLFTSDRVSIVKNP